ncbi:YqzL family protein [Virgibacillus natechei]
MIDITWKLFSQTGNIETYLLMKELENDSKSHEVVQTTNVDNRPLNTKV